MDKSYMERAVDFYNRNEDFKGSLAVREGVIHYSGIIKAMFSETPTQDVGILLYAIEAMTGAIEQAVPNAKEVKRLAQEISPMMAIIMPRNEEEET